MKKNSNTSSFISPIKRFFRISIIDRYILKKYFKTIFFAFFGISIISVAIDVSEKLDAFLDEKILDYSMIYYYYLDFVPTTLAIIFPLFVFISVIFFTSKLANKTEFIPMLTSGLSLIDILKPYLFGSIIMGSILWTGNQNLLPIMNSRKIDFLDNYVYRRKATKFSNYYLRTSVNDYFVIKRFDTFLKRGFKASFFKIDSNLKMKMFVKAPFVQFQNETNEWVMQNPTIFYIKEQGEIITKPQEYILPFRLKLDEVIFKKYEKLKMTSSEIKAFVEKEKFRGKEGITTFEHEYYVRISQPVSVIIMSLMGCIISYRKMRGGSGLKLALGVVLGAVFFMLDRISSVFSANLSFNPLLSAWIPNIIFIFVTLYLYFKSSK